MSGAFQANAFQSDAFQEDASTAGITAGGGMFIFADHAPRRAQEAEKRRIAAQIAAVLADEETLVLLEVI